MASITFAVIDNANVGSGITGSGLGFYGSSFGASVSTLSYQDTTFVTNADGTDNGGSVKNIKFLGNASGCYLGPAAATGILTDINGSEATLMINFNHTIPVKVQNCQLRIYNRANIDTPAVGVITKVAEIVNFNNIAYNTWVSSPGNDTGNRRDAFGDAYWWGVGWPSGAVYTAPTYDTSVRPYYINSVGVKFNNFTDYQYINNSGNPDAALSATPPAYETVGGSGLIVPLLDSPGSGGRFLHTGVTPAFKPKFTQYVNTTYQALLGRTVPYASSTYLADTYGGTGYDLMHTWRVAISASPLSIGSKTNFGLYVSLEYL